MAHKSVAAFNGGQKYNIHQFLQSGWIEIEKYLRKPKPTEISILTACKYCQHFDSMGALGPPFP